MGVIRRSIVAVVLIASMLGLVAPTPAGAALVSQAETLDEILGASDYRESDANLLRLYRAFFERTPDVVGAKYWIQQARFGASLDTIAESFAASTEFANTYGNVGDERFLEIVYTNVLGRGYDQGGFNYWLGQVRAGLTRGGVVRWVAANDEFIGRYPFAPVAQPQVAPPNPPPSASSCVVVGLNSIGYIEFRVSVTNDSGRDADGTLNIVGRIDGQRVDDQLMGVDLVRSGQYAEEDSLFLSKSTYEGVAVGRVTCEIASIRWRANPVVASPNGCRLLGTNTLGYPDIRIELTNPRSVVSDSSVHLIAYIDGIRVDDQLAGIDDVGAGETASKVSILLDGRLRSVPPGRITCEALNARWSDPR